MSGVALNVRERTVVSATDIGRLATISINGWPHVVPVGYVYSDGIFYVPSNKKAVKIRNLKLKPKATLVIDNEEKEWGVMLECSPEILSDSQAERWRRYMRDVKGWRNDRTTTVIKLKPMRKASWFLKD